MKNQYHKTRISRIQELSKDTKLFRLQKAKGVFGKNSSGLSFVPGQFVLAGLFGYGEAPFGPASPPHRGKYLEIVVRRAGIVTTALHNLKEGDEVYLRGPYGNGFPIEFMEAKDIVAVTGGCGIPPIAALMEHIAKHRDYFGRVYLIYGARTPADLLLKNRIKRWEKRDINVLLTVDKPDKVWKGHVGLVTKLIDYIKIDPKKAASVMCGPGPMMNAIERILRPLGISDRRIFVNMERRMQCGIGKCQHCTTGDKYVCQDGPVFNFDEIDKNWD